MNFTLSSIYYSLDKNGKMVNNVVIGKNPKGVWFLSFRVLLTPYLSNLSAMIIIKISHSAFSVIQNFTFSSPPFALFPLNLNVCAVVNRSLPIG